MQAPSKDVYIDGLGSAKDDIASANLLQSSVTKDSEEVSAKELTK